MKPFLVTARPGSLIRVPLHEDAKQHLPSSWPKPPTGGNPHDGHHQRSDQMAADMTDRPEVLPASEQCDGLGGKGRKSCQTAKESRDYKQRHFQRNLLMQIKQLDENPN